MIRLRAITWAIGIWTTAVSTLLAGMPHLQCRCPDGRIKPFCWSILLPSTCCNRSCCSDPAGFRSELKKPEAAKKPCCCCQASRQAENHPSQQIRPQGCQKTIAKVQTVSPSDHVRYSANDFIAGTLAIASSAPI